MTKHKIAVCMISREQMHTHTAFDLANLMVCTNKAGHSVTLCANVGTGIFSQREAVARDALSKGADWLMWLDSDMRFPPDSALRLLERKRDIIGCNYPTKEAQPMPTARGLNADKTVWSVVDTLPSSTGVEEVAGLGFGCILTAARVYREIKEDKVFIERYGIAPPWFMFQHSAVNNMPFGEDLFFSQRAEAVGIKTHLDHDLSKLVRHIGSFEYTMDHVAAIREMEEAKAA